jgi:Txe/YoeB family toxin of Txe-Axe toxin-antitoxin module
VAIVNAFDAWPSHAEITAIGTSCKCISVPHEKLVGARAGQYSIRVNNQWRICFTWSSSGAGNVELVDYH